MLSPDQLDRLAKTGIAVLLVSVIILILTHLSCFAVLPLEPH